MKKSNLLPGLGAAAGMLALILDGSTALSGAREGIDLCLRVVIPSLFPFFVLSGLLSGALLGESLPLLRPLARLAGLPRGAESILAAGLLGGYPVGARCVGDACRAGRLSPRDGRRMLPFCNNAGPAFLFGIAGSLFSSPFTAWGLWGIQILSALLTALWLPGRSTGEIAPGTGHVPTLPQALSSAVTIQAGVCGWVVVFRILLAFLGRWFGWLLPEGAQLLLSGVLELTNGCTRLSTVANPGQRFVLCSGFLAFGGLCVGLQTRSAAQGVDHTLYFPGKLLQTIYAVALSMLAQFLFPREYRWAVPPMVPVALLIATLVPIFLKKPAIWAGNPRPQGV